MRIRIIVNPAAGSEEPVLSVLNNVFGPAGIDWDVAVTHKSGDGVIAAREAADKGFDLVGVYGGDGTVTEVAAALAQGGPPMLLLPGGTGNALADDLGIPPRLEDAVALAIEGASEVRRIDLGRAGDRWFVLRLTMGFEAAMVGAATREMKDRYGWLAYVMAGLQTISDPPVATYSMTIDGETIECEGLGAVVANSASIGVAGVKLAENVDVADGVLDVVVLQRANLPSLLGSASDAAQGQEPRGLSRWRGTDIRIDSSPEQMVLADGEKAGSTPVHVSVVPGGLSVLVPATSGDQSPE